jgi:hypothetical protein
MLRGTAQNLGSRDGPGPIRVLLTHWLAGTATSFRPAAQRQTFQIAFLPESKPVPCDVAILINVVDFR